MAGLKQIMEIFMTINQPLSSEQRVRWYKQRIHLFLPSQIERGNV